MDSSQNSILGCRGRRQQVSTHLAILLTLQLYSTALRCCPDHEFSATYLYWERANWEVSSRKADSSIQLIHPQHRNRHEILLQHSVPSMVTGPLDLERLQPLLVLPNVGQPGRRVAHLYNVTPSLPFLSLYKKKANRGYIETPSASGPPRDDPNSSGPNLPTEYPTTFGAMPSNSWCYRSKSLRISHFPSYSVRSTTLLSTSNYSRRWGPTPNPNLFWEEHMIAS